MKYFVWISLIFDLIEQAKLRLLFTFLRSDKFFNMNFQYFKIINSIFGLCKYFKTFN